MTRQWQHTKCTAGHWLSLALSLVLPFAFMLAWTPAVAALSEPPLVNTLWLGDGSRLTSEAVLSQRLRRADFVLIGEIHSNPDHHRFQAAMLAGLAEAGRRVALVWEMIPLAQQTTLNEWQASGQPARALGPALNWSSSGWPDWALYEPIANVAAQYALPMVATGLERSELRQVSRDGFGGFSAMQRLRLGLERPLPRMQRQSMLEALRIGHCNLMPSSALSGMLNVQRLRDSEMAARMQQAAGATGAVLIAGNGHIRKDWAVPAILRGKRPRSSVVSIAQIEVEPGKTEPAQYRLSEGSGPLYDFVRFTHKHDLKDHCAELREQMKRPAR